VHTEFLLGDLRERYHSEHLGIDERIILKNLYLRSGMGRHGLNCSNSGCRQVTGAYECGNKASGSIK
jgi:hypothetical protein